MCVGDVDSLTEDVFDHDEAEGVGVDGRVELGCHHAHTDIY